MIRLTALPALITLSAAALLIPLTASADDRYYHDRDRDRDYRSEREYREYRKHREHERRERERREREWRAHERREHRDRYRDGYYDRWGYWHPYR